MSVKRYDIGTFGGMSMESISDGAYVHHEDYAALEARCAALASENAGLKNALEWLYETVSSESVSISDEKYSSVTNAAQVLSETPATDAFLAEVRAQGVEMFANNLESMQCHIEAKWARSFISEVISVKNS